jgi:hypothetical protein
LSATGRQKSLGNGNFEIGPGFTGFNGKKEFATKVIIRLNANWFKAKALDVH